MEHEIPVFLAAVFRGCGGAAAPVQKRSVRAHSLPVAALTDYSAPVPQCPGEGKGPKAIFRAQGLLLYALV